MIHVTTIPVIIVSLWYIIRFLWELIDYLINCLQDFKNNIIGSCVSSIILVALPLACMLLCRNLIVYGPLKI